MYLVDPAICWQILVDDQTWFETTPLPSVWYCLSDVTICYGGFSERRQRSRRLAVGWEVLHFDNLSNNLPISLFSLSLGLGRFFIDWSIDFKRLGFSFQPPAAHPTPVSFNVFLPIYPSIFPSVLLHIFPSVLLPCPTRPLTTPITLVNNPLVFLSVQLQQQHSLSVFLYSTLAFTLYAAPTSDAAFTPQATLSSYSAIYLLSDF